MAYTEFGTKTTTDVNAAADVNALARNVEALKGGAASAQPVVTLADVLPVGTILPYAGATAPTGYLICDGRTLGKEADDTTFPDGSGTGAPTVVGTQYETLYGVLAAAAARWEIPAGTATWGTHKIYLPNLQDAFLRGEVGGAASIFTDSTKRSAGLGKKQDDAMQGHAHQIEDGTLTNFYRNNVQAGTGKVSPADGASDVVTAKTIITDGTNGTPRTATESRPKNVGVNYIIKY